MAWSENAKLRLRLAGFWLAVVCPVPLVLFVRDAPRQIASMGWPCVEGPIVALSIVGTAVGWTVSFFSLRGWLKTWADRRRSRRSETAGEWSESVPPPVRYEHGRSSPISALGEIQQAHRPRSAVLVAIIAFGMVLTVGALAAAIWIVSLKAPRPLGRPDEIAKYGGAAIIGVLGPLGGLALVVRGWRLFSHWILVGENGLAYVYRGWAEIILWEHIDEVREVRSHESFHIFTVPWPAIRYVVKTLFIRRIDGKEFNVTADYLPQLVARLRVMSDECGIPWETVQE